MCTTNIKTPLKMVEVNMNKLVLLIALCFIMTPYSVSAACTRLRGCEEGERCDGEECIACEHRFYQDSTMHRQVACKPWTVKHISENWMVVVNGSATRDVQYACMPGYVEKTFTKGGTECVPAPTTSTKTSTQATITDVSSTPVDTSLTNNTAQVTNEEKFKDVYIILICFGILLVAVVVIFAVCFMYKKYKKQQKKRLGSRANNGTARIPSDIDNGESIPLADYSRFLNLFREILDLKSGRKLIRIIPDPSRRFKAQNRLQLNRECENNPVNYHARTLHDWLDLNPNITSETYVTWSTDYVKVGGVENVSTVEVNGQQLLLPEAQAPISTDQCFHKLCYFLGENLGDSVDDFIFNLKKDSNLPLKNIMDRYTNDYKDLVAGFVDALAEWKSTQTDQLLIAARFESALHELNQNDLLDDRIYKSLIEEFQLSLSQQ